MSAINNNHLAGYKRCGGRCQKYHCFCDFILSCPILTVQQMETALDMPYVAARRYVDKLAA